MAKSHFFTSSVGRKIIVGLTGLFLISFLLIHLTANATMLLNDNGTTFNSIAHFLSHNLIIRVMEVGLFIGFILHIAMTLKLTIENKKKRPVQYAVFDGKENSKWYARSMAILGSLILIFAAVHLYQFWLPTKVAVYTGAEENTFEMVKTALTNPISLALYLLGFGSLGFHLLHGFQSAFKSLGLSHKKYTPIIKKIGTAYAILVPAGFAIIALAIFFGLVQ